MTTRQPFTANSGLEKYEDILSETALYGRAHFPENATFLAYLSHMSGVIPYYFFALWDRQCSYEAWTDEMIALGERRASSSRRTCSPCRLPLGAGQSGPCGKLQSLLGSE